MLQQRQQTDGPELEIPQGVTIATFRSRQSGGKKKNGIMGTLVGILLMVAVYLDMSGRNKLSTINDLSNVVTKTTISSSTTTAATTTTIQESLPSSSSSSSLLSLQDDQIPHFQTLLDQGKAQTTHIQTFQPTRMEFDMMIFPPTIDKYISGKLLQRPISYEQEVSQFLHVILQADDASEQQSSSSPPYYWAVDLGANIGFHALHMASLKTAKIIALEPAADTFAILKGGLALNPGFDQRLTVVHAGATDGTTIQETNNIIMHRHPSSPGMTTLAQAQDLPDEWRMQEVNNKGENGETTVPQTIRLVPVERLLDEAQLPQKGKPTTTSPSRLRLLKVDVEGYELKALKGVNLSKYPFEYILMEYFPQMLRAAAGRNTNGEDDDERHHPAEVLEYLMLTHGYICVNYWTVSMTDDSVFEDYHRIIGNTQQEIRNFADNFEGKHTNVYCRSTKRPVGI